MPDGTVTNKPNGRPQLIETDQIKQIYDYTKFHIGLYSTLLTGLIALVTFSKGKEFGLQHQGTLFWIIGVLLIGGIAGALAASRIVYGPWESGSFNIESSWFWKKRWRPLWKSWWGVGDLALLVEHHAFWLALFIAIITLVLR